MLVVRVNPPGKDHWSVQVPIRIWQSIPSRPEFITPGTIGEGPIKSAFQYALVLEGR